MRNMPFRTTFTSKKLPFVAFLAIGIFCFTTATFAQSDKDEEKGTLEVIKENPIIEVDDLSLETGSEDSNQSLIIRRNQKTTAVPSTPVRKENNEKVVAKKEEGSSTLSFNLFLYIVDKFKAD